MKIFYDFEKISDNFKNILVTIGNFDGIHLGHQKIFKELQNDTALLNGTALVINFVPHPRSVIDPLRTPPLLTTLKSRLKLMQEMGIEAVLLAHFDRNFAEISPEKFIKEYLVDKLKIKEIVIGENYFFGKNKQGDIDFLKKNGKIYNFKVHSVPPFIIDEKIVSSSIIRDFIRAGDMLSAKKFLGREYSICGKVVNGSKRGKKLGFPTANLQAITELIPKKGVYYTKVQISGREFAALTNIGFRPTFDEKNEIIETHILNFNESIYDKEITILFIKKIRDEKKFNSESELKAQIAKDIEQAKREMVKSF